jgi:hypothetical protein
VTHVVDDGQCVSTASIVVEVISPCEAVEQLIAKVNNADLGRKNKRPLIASLKATCASYERGNCNSASSQLKAFQNKVRAQITRLNPAAATDLINMAQMILDCVHCEK